MIVDKELLFVRTLPSVHNFTAINDCGKWLASLYHLVEQNSATCSHHGLHDKFTRTGHLITSAGGTATTSLSPGGRQVGKERY